MSTVRRGWRTALVLGFSAYVVFVSVMLGLGIASLLVAAASHADWIVHRFKGWFLVVAIFAVCAGLFFVRGKYRLAYGITEILLGIAAVADTVMGAGTKSLYLVVRGMDNCREWWREWHDALVAAREFMASD